MHRAGDARVETVDSAQDFDGLFRIIQLVAFQRCFVRPFLALRVARAGIPCRRDDSLVIVDLGIPDHDPVRQRTARRLRVADAFRNSGPA